MFYVQNTTGTWGAILRDGTTPIPVSGTVKLLNMSPGTTYTVSWYDTDTGVLIRQKHVTASSGGRLPLLLPNQITQSIAAIATAN
jgi:hypothetical protein